MRINDKHNDLIALICANMPKDLRDTLLAKIQFIYPDVVKCINTAEEGFENSFPSAHFCVWFRYATRVSRTLLKYSHSLTSFYLGRRYTL
jgi:hypothetical protein